MKKITISCFTCNAECNIIHDLDEPYMISFCPFCGEEIEKEIEMDYEDYEIFDDEYKGYD